MLCASAPCCLCAPPPAHQPAPTYPPRIHTRPLNPAVVEPLYGHTGSPWRHALLCGPDVWLPAPLPPQDEDEGGMEEPPEISQFVQELGGALGQEAGPLGGAAAGGGGPQPPRWAAGRWAGQCRGAVPWVHTACSCVFGFFQASQPMGRSRRTGSHFAALCRRSSRTRSGVLSRMVATFACGVVSLAAQGLGWAGNTGGEGGHKACSLCTPTLTCGWAELPPAVCCRPHLRLLGAPLACSRLAADGHTAGPPPAGRARGNHPAAQAVRGGGRYGCPQPAASGNAVHAVLPQHVARHGQGSAACTAPPQLPARPG